FRSGRGADAFGLAGQRGLFGQHRLGGEQRELEAAGAGVEDKDGLHASIASRFRWAISCTMAHDAARVSAVSARLVSTMGTRAPSTTPAISASARYSSCLATMLPDSRSGTTRMSALPARIGRA